MIYKNMKMLMVKHDLTQENLARMLGISKSTLNLKLNDKRDFHKPEIDRIIKILDGTYEFIFQIDGDNFSKGKKK